LASSLIETLPEHGDEDRTMTNRTPLDRHRTLHLLAVLAGLSAALGGCNTSGEVVTASVPNDYRLRHPIAIEEANRSLVIFVGQARGGLSVPQRTDVIGLAQTWVREGTGAIVADVPVDTPNARAAAATFHEIKTLLGAGGVPSRGIMVRHYHPDDPRTLATIRLSYPRIAAVAGPCGLWPEDLGPSVLNENYSENKEYYNFGCAYQRNMAAMVENPSDLVQPRPETPAYTARRSEAFEKYRKGIATTTTYPEADKAKLSDTGK
jgi:pilus assembly protein CpaD